MAKAIDAAAEVLARVGFEVVEIPVPAELLAEVAELHPLVMKPEGAANHMNTMRERQDDYTLEVGHRLHAIGRRVLGKERQPRVGKATL